MCLFFHTGHATYECLLIFTEDRGHCRLLNFLVDLKLTIVVSDGKIAIYRVRFLSCWIREGGRARGEG